MGALFVDSTLNTTKKDASRFQNHFQLVLCCHLTHVMPQISRSTRSSDASPCGGTTTVVIPRPGCMQVGPELQHARSWGSPKQSPCRAKARKQTRQCNAARNLPPARCASRNRPFPQPFPIRWTLRDPGGVGPAGADRKYYSRPRSGHSGKPGFMLLGVLHWGPCNGRITVSVRTGGVRWGASHTSVGGLPPFNKGPW